MQFGRDDVLASAAGDERCRAMLWLSALLVLCEAAAKKG